MIIPTINIYGYKIDYKINETFILEKKQYNKSKKLELWHINLLKGLVKNNGANYIFPRKGALRYLN